MAYDKDSIPERPTLDEKQFSLKSIELNLIANGQARAQQALFDICTFIATERLAWHVSERTQFRVEGDKLFISDLPEVKEDEIVSEAK